MSHLRKLTLAFLLLVPIAAAPAMAIQTEIELSTTGEMPDFSGSVVISDTPTGEEALAVRVNSPLPNGTTARVTYVKGGEEHDLAVVNFKVGSALFEIDSNQPTGIFPTSKVDAFFVYFKNLRVLEAKHPS